jgi:hypothetical protein
MIKRGKKLRLTSIRWASAIGLVALLIFVIARLPSLRAKDGTLSGPTAKLRVVDLAGTPYQMGKVHGQALKAEIQELVKRWEQDLEKTYQVPADVFIREFLRKTDFKPAMDRWTPGRSDEAPFQVLGFSPRSGR